MFIVTNLQDMEQGLAQDSQEVWENMEQEVDLEEKLSDWELEQDLLEDTKRPQPRWECIIDTSNTGY